MNLKDYFEEYVQIIKRVIILSLFVKLTIKTVAYTNLVVILLLAALHTLKLLTQKDVLKKYGPVLDKLNSNSKSTKLL
jgi:hypothetical protein